MTDGFRAIVLQEAGKPELTRMTDADLMAGDVTVAVDYSTINFKDGLALTGKLLGQSVSLALSAAATVILLYFLLASEHWMLSRVVEAVPRRRTRALLLGGVRAAQRQIGRYVVALGLINVAAGVATGLALWSIGLPNPTLWGAVTAVVVGGVATLGVVAVVAWRVPALRRLRQLTPPRALP